jgi:hypothetical protein
MIVVNMHKQQGSSNDSREEQLRLVNNVGRVLPIVQVAWEAVRAVCNSDATSKSPACPVESLKRKFNSLWRVFESTDADHRTALQVLSRDVTCQIDE